VADPGGEEAELPPLLPSLILYSLPIHQSITQPALHLTWQPVNSHWTYEPSESIPYHRLLLRHNFCENARGYWTETNSSRSGPARGFRHRNEFAYPVNTLGKPAAIARIAQWAKAHRILPLGRWGTWEHMNSDVAVDDAMRAAEVAIHA